jgi:hypothetical protein
VNDLLHSKYMSYSFEASAAIGLCLDGGYRGASYIVTC